jgi:transposase-like protein
MARRVRFTEAQLREVIASSLSYSEALRKLGLRPAGGNHGTIKKYVERWGISTAHFDPYAARPLQGRRRIPLAEILIEDSTYHRGHLKRRLFAEGFKQPRCELCGQGETWRGQPLALILDHINGVPDDHRLENLRIVCPNCAATLDTHCGRKNRPASRRSCARCGAVFFAAAPEQRYCSRECGQRWDRHGHPRLGGRKVDRPPYEQLLAEIEATNYCAVGRKYGVSDNAIRKWVRQYEREQAPAGVGGVPGPGWVLVSGERFEEILRRERAGGQGFDDLAPEDREIHARVRQLLAHAG